MFFLHYDDPTFEAFGGLYIPYASQLEAERQAANDLIDVQNDPKAIGLLGIFEAEYGSHRRGNDQDLGGGLTARWYNYNEPFGHLNPQERKAILSQSEIAKKAVQHQNDLNQEAIKAQEDYLLAIHKAIQSGEPLPWQMSVPGNAYTVVSGGTATAGAIALVAATAKTIIGIAAGAANQPSIVEGAISFDGTSAAAVPVLCEWCSGTNATNPPGTASTTMTAKQIRGWPAQASAQTAAYNWTTEPTVQEVFKKRLLTPNGGLLIFQQPQGREPTAIVTASTQFKFVGLRVTAPAIVNVHVDLEYEE